MGQFFRMLASHMVRLRLRAVALLSLTIATFLTVAAPLSTAAGGLAITLSGPPGAAAGAEAHLQFHNRFWMLDCGVAPDDERGAAAAPAPDQAPLATPPAAATFAGVFITHAHRDHIGRLPQLVREGFQGRIYLTEATARIGRVMLREEIAYDNQQVRNWCWSSRQARGSSITPVHWFPDCDAARAITARRRRQCACTLAALYEQLARPRPCRKCAKRETARIARLFTIVRYGTTILLDKGLTAVFLPAGHIPGAASVLFTCREEKRALRVLFSGDLGNELSTLIPGPPVAPPADVIFVEATYGSHHRSPVEATTADFRRELAAALQAGKIVWIPAFALDRTQKILHQIVMAQQEGRVPRDIPLWCA